MTRPPCAGEGLFVVRGHSPTPDGVTGERDVGPEVPTAGLQHRGVALGGLLFGRTMRKLSERPLLLRSRCFSPTSSLGKPASAAGHGEQLLGIALALDIDPSASWHAGCDSRANFSLSSPPGAAVDLPVEFALAAMRAPTCIQRHELRRGMVVGIISDTHGLMRPEALKALAGSSLIIHAGDVGGLKVLEELRGIAPVFAVRGNVDKQSWAAALPATRVISVGSYRFFVLHNISELAIDPVRQGIAAVVFGHSHKPSIEWRGDVLYLNPGSAGPRRFRRPVCVATVEIAGKRIRPRITRLDLP